ncbi:MAG: hypothetical protein K6U00_09660 [Armatimonadetes bacterium]|nr:hypothetical protein [Armatimonadota bacterium]
MNMPFGEIKDKVLEIRFSSADYSIATVLTAVREHLDVLQEMGVKFLGAATDVYAGPTPVFKPTDIKAVFEYAGSGDAKQYLERAYEIVWQGVVKTFPDESAWAEAKQSFGDFILAQADLLRARRESSERQ